MVALQATLLCLAASVANAHFAISYPEWRGDSFAAGASQYTYPCAGVNQTSLTNRTIWPLTGGSLALEVHHKWTYVFVNLGLGTNYPVFNISLTPNFLNETGNGTMCLPKLSLPAGVSVVDGQNASIQVVTVGQSGSALYNCADITFRANATIQSGSTCANTSNIVITAVAEQTAKSSNTSSSSSATTSAKSAGVSDKQGAYLTAVFAVVGGSVLMASLL